FKKTHTKYSRSPHYNMDCRGFHCVQDFAVEVYENNKTQRSRDAVQGYIDHVGDDAFSEYVYYRTQDAWGLPYIFIFAANIL
ncbi:unnamed protein product, partial [marine sediment metagenome]